MKWLKQLLQYLKSRPEGGTSPEIKMGKEIDPLKIRVRAEQYYRSGDFFCSEAIVKAIVEGFHLPVPNLVIAMASGFPLGIGGSGCTCGALTGGVMALGLFFGRTEPNDRKVKKCMKLSKTLHNHFRDRYPVVCCRDLTKGMRMGSSKHMEQCISITGEIAEETARIILNQKGIE